ncbi:hypothetical protein Ddye_005556, partial [Dipteronia dyeriana]
LLLEMGLMWKVGDGSKIVVYKDRWVSKQTSFKVLSPMVLGENTIVNQLINSNGG